MLSCRYSIHSLLLVLAGMLLLGSPVQAQQPDVDKAMRYLETNVGALGLQALDVSEMKVSDNYTTKKTGVRHVYLQQYHKGIPVFGAIASVAIAADGSVLHAGNRLVPNLVESIRGGDRALDPPNAVELSARSLGFEITEPLTVEARKRDAKPSKSPHDVVLSRGGVSLDPIPVNLVYLPMPSGEVRLAWAVGIYTEDAQHYWNSFVDASTGEVLQQVDLVVQENAGVFENTETSFSAGVRASMADAPLIPYAETISALSSNSAPVTAGGSYRVYPVPVESPSHAGDPNTDLRVLVVDPEDATASPLGWHNDGSTAYTVTRGNNVHAYTDIDADNLPDAGSDPDGGAGLVFDFPLDLTQAPSTYRDAAVTNLFYWNNVTHDIAYQYGFDEASGNFQVDNLGNGGLGADDVRAEAQDGSGTNNANFFTPIDGNRPRMQMFVWSIGFPNELVVGAPVSDTFEMTRAVFGPQFDAIGVTGTLVLAQDGAGVSSTDGCEPLTNGLDISGNIALIDRGACTFVTKVQNAEAVGATAVVIVNSVAGSPITMGGAAGVGIPSGMISLADGDVIKASLPVDGTARAASGNPPDRDSDFDNGVIVHEYAHGISNRLTGGPGENICLANFLVNGQVDGEQMGEGWSDYFGLLFTDTDTDNRGIATYLLGEPTSGQGIRPFTYSTSLAVNPSTYQTINSPGISVPHGVGTVWATMLWDMTRDLVGRHGFDSDLYGGSGGNNTALQLVTDGLKLQPCFPGFVDGRDAILAADAAMGSQNQCLIWDAFARRGLGASADQGFFFTRLDGTEAFDLPNSCCTFEMLTQKVDDLEGDGTLNGGQAKSLRAKLTNAAKKVNQGKLTAAFGILHAFVNQVNAFESAGILTEEQADDLTSCIEGLLARIAEENGGQAAKFDAGLAWDDTVPEEFGLLQNYPNPFNPQTEIEFALPEGTHVRLAVYDILGREVQRLVDRELPAGVHRARFDALRLSSGTYFYRIEAGEFVSVKQMMLVK